MDVIILSVIFCFGVAFAWVLLQFSTWLMKKNHLLYGPVFIPSRDQDIQDMIDLARIKTGEVVADLGSGDGKVVILLAQQGIHAHGYENSPSLVWQSRQRIRHLGLERLATIHWQDFWHADLTQYDVLMMYTSQFTMEQLEEKIRRSLKPGARVVSNTFQFPHWRAKKVLGKISLY